MSHTWLQVVRVLRCPASASRLRLSHCPPCLRPWLRCCARWWWRCFCSPLFCSRSSFPQRAWSTRCWSAIFCSSTSRSLRPPAARRTAAGCLPYRDVERGDIVVFHHPDPPYLVKRVVGIPGDRSALKTAAST